MEEEPMEAIRETNRNRVFLNRRKQKDEETDIRRSLANLQLSPADVAALANKLKTKTSITASELKLLQNALIDDPKNIEVVLKTHGALRGLVRELTGHNVSKQIASCGCLCNLSLGDSKTCSTVAKAAGAYLVATLDTLTTQLAETCAWSLGNMAGAGARACDVILAQGALAKLCDVTQHAGDVRQAALYGLTHLAYVLKDDLKTENLQQIVRSLSEVDLDVDSTQLLYIISCHKDFCTETLPEHYLKRIVGKLPAIIENHINVCKNQQSTHINKKCCELIYLIRFLANLNDGIFYQGFLDYFVFNNSVGHFKRLLNIDTDSSICWLLGNMLNCCSDHVFFHQLCSDIPTS